MSPDASKAQLQPLTGQARPAAAHPANCAGRLARAATDSGETTPRPVGPPNETFYWADDRRLSEGHQHCPSAAVRYVAGKYSICFVFVLFKFKNLTKGYQSLNQTHSSGHPFLSHLFIQQTALHTTVTR